MWFKDPNHLPQSSYYRPLSNVWLGVTSGGCGIAGAKFQRDTAICQKRRACVVPSYLTALGACDVAGGRGEGGRDRFEQP